MATARRRYLQDLVIGATAESRPYTVLLADMLDIARRYDPQYFHTDPDAAKASIFGEVIASGIYSAAIWRRLDHEVSGDIAWICGIAWKEVVWRTPMRAGDVVRARAGCLSKRRSRSNLTCGMVGTRYTLVHQSGLRQFGGQSQTVRRYKYVGKAGLDGIEQGGDLLLHVSAAVLVLAAFLGAHLPGDRSVDLFPAHYDKGRLLGASKSVNNLRSKSR